MTCIDLNILQLDCVVGMGYVDRFILGSMLPLIGMFVYGLVAALLLKLGWQCAQKMDRSAYLKAPGR